MDELSDKSDGKPSPIHRADGITKAERYLKRLADKTFLSLWSHAGIYRDQGRVAGKGHGKELCDLLVVFEDHIVIFSDKDCKYPTTDDPIRNWSRWYRKAIDESARQILGAERWIREHPQHIYLDRSCTQRFPIGLPETDRMRVHRVVVAHNASEYCRQTHGGSGSLMIVPPIADRMHYDAGADFPPSYPFGVQPFVIGRVHSSKGYVHVLDDTSLDIVMRARDTIADFVDYLSKKEAFIQSDRLLSAAGEEELLAYYLKERNVASEHDFVVPGSGVLVIHEGTWEQFEKSPERRAQQKADEISYLWDREIEKFAHHFLNGTYYQCSHPTYADLEKVLRSFAREPRVRRRFLSRALYELVDKGAEAECAMRVVPPSGPADPHYIFLTYRHSLEDSEPEYRDKRFRLLLAHAKVAKLRFPEAQTFVCYATEPGLHSPRRSEDALYVDVRNWTAENAAEARDLQQKSGFFTNLIESRIPVVEYPLPVSPNQLFKVGLRRAPMSKRNSPCPCRSGKKFKKCCGQA